MELKTQRENGPANSRVSYARNNTYYIRVCACVSSLIWRLVYARCRSRGIALSSTGERQPCFTNTYVQTIKSILFTHGRDLLDDRIIRLNIQSLRGAEGKKEKWKNR